jgi:protein TonB
VLEQNFADQVSIPMASSSKQNEVLIIPHETTTAAVATNARPDDTSTGSRPLPVALEVPVTVNGARTVEGSDKREPFSETTKTVLVFGNGAVIRLGSPVAVGQLLFLTNEKTKKEVVCQVVKSKNYKSVSGYVELEFTESVVGFWGMRFPSDRIGPQMAASAPTATMAPAVTGNPVVPVSVAPKVASPVVAATPKIAEVKPARIQAEVKPAQVSAELKPAPPARPVEAKPLPPAAPKVTVPVVQNAPAPLPPIAKKPEVPAAPVASAPTVSASHASSDKTVLSAPLGKSVVTSPILPAAAISSENSQQPTSVAVQNSTEELKLQAARLQEQLSSLLFSAAQTAKPVTSAPAVPPSLDAKPVSAVVAKVSEIAKSEPTPIKVVPPAKISPPPMKSSLDTEEVKIPSWLEPLARNAAAAPSAQELSERERVKHPVETVAREEHSVEPIHAAGVESSPDVELPGVGSLLPLEEEVATHDRSSGGSNKGVLFGAIAAAVLVVAGGAWYFLRPASAAQGTLAPIAPAASNQVKAAPDTASQPASQAITKPITAPQPAAGSNAAPVSATPADSAPASKSSVNPQLVPITRDGMRGSGTTIPAAVTERISRPPAEPEPKKPALGQVHLASPTLTRPGNTQDGGVDAPTISASNADANGAGLNSGLVAGNEKQPAAPEAPLIIGGDVKPAKLMNAVAATYPALAKSQHVSGNVVVDALIDATGHVTTMKVISGPSLLHQAAKDALHQWKYQPASLDGKPVAMHLTVTLQFRLQ